MGARGVRVTVVLLGVVAGLCTVALTGVARTGHPAGAPSHRPVVSVRPAVAPARSEVLEVLRGWDQARARAWAAGDVPALVGLYTAGSGAGRADRRLLQRYLDRGLVVRRMTTQLFSVHVLTSDARHLRVVVTDRLAGGVAVSRGREIGLPGDMATTRLLVLRREGGTWRMVSVKPWGTG